jgi:GNAT superfamily N-acetyltransferase
MTLWLMSSIEKPQELKHLYTTLISPLIKHSYPPSTPSQNTVPPDTLKTYELAPRASFLGVVPAYRGKGAARAMFDAWHAHVEGIHAQGARADDVEECTAALTAMEPGELVSMYEHLGYRVVKRYSAKMRVSGDEFEFVDMLRTWSKVCVSEAEQTV